MRKAGIPAFDILMVKEMHNMTAPLDISTLADAGNDFKDMRNMTALLDTSALDDAGNDFKEMRNMTSPFDTSRGQREPAFNQF